MEEGRGGEALAELVLDAITAYGGEYVGKDLRGTWSAFVSREGGREVPSRECCRA